MVAGALALILVVGSVWPGGLAVPVIRAPFEGAFLTPIGLTSAAFQLVLTVGVLAGLEACLRTSHTRARRRTKFVVLGLGGIFLVNFYALSQAVLFRSIGVIDLKIGAATVLIGNVVLALGLARVRSSDMEVTVSRALLYRSVIVGVLGAYLLAVGGIGWLLKYLEISGHTVGITVGIFVSAIGLAAVLLSEEARWRLKRFLAVHVYRSKYDYREQWIAFTRRLGTLLTLDELSPELVEAISQAVDSNAAMLYLVDTSGRQYYLAGTFDVRGAPATVSADDSLMLALASRQEPLVLDAPLQWDDGVVVDTFAEGTVAVPLTWRGALTGVVIVGH